MDYAFGRLVNKIFYQVNPGGWRWYSWSKQNCWSFGGNAINKIKTCKVNRLMTVKEGLVYILCLFENIAYIVPYCCTGPEEVNLWHYQCSWRTGLIDKTAKNHIRWKWCCWTLDVIFILSCYFLLLMIFFMTEDLGYLDQESCMIKCLNWRFSYDANWCHFVVIVKCDLENIRITMLFAMIYKKCVGISVHTNMTAGQMMPSNKIFAKLVFFDQSIWIFLINMGRT